MRSGDESDKTAPPLSLPLFLMKRRLNDGYGERELREVVFEVEDGDGRLEED